MSEIRVTSVVGENGGDRVGLTTGLTVGPLTGTTGIGATITHQGHAQFAGVCTATNVSAASSVTATTFYGSGANLTGLTAGITVADCWYVTSAFTNPNGNGGFIAADWSRFSVSQSGNVGAAINQYGGTFSFNQTGIYLIDATVGCHITSNGRDRYVAAALHTGTGGHNGSFTQRTNSFTNLGAQYSTTHGFVRTSLMMDVTSTGAANTSVDCFRLYTNSENSSTIIKGDSNTLQTYFTVIRLGDT